MASLILKTRMGAKGIKVFVSRAVRDGQVQRAFAEQIGKPVGGCVASKVHTGMTGGQVHDAARECAKAKKGVKLTLGGWVVGRATRKRRAAAAGEYD